MSAEPPIALVTGASAGLGAEFARQLARRGNRMVLVGRNRDRLELLAAEFGGAEVLVADLATEVGVEAVAARLKDQDRPISTLVNNAGFGTADSFLDSTPEYESDSVEVMVRAVTLLSKTAAEAMVERGHGMILNVSSVAALLPGGSYSAAKAFVLTLTESLALELQDTGVQASVVLPGFTRTQFHQRADIDTTAIPEWMWLDSGEVARTALTDASQGRVVCVPGLQYRALSALLQALPRPFVRRLTGTKGAPSMDHADTTEIPDTAKTKAGKF